MASASGSDDDEFVILVCTDPTNEIEESSYFRGLLGGSFSESCLDCISIQWHLETFLNVVKCMFHCPLDITSKNFIPLFQAALYFGVEILLLQLKSWFSEVSVSKDPGLFQIQLDDLIDIWNFGLEHANGFVQELCASYFARNFMWAMSSKFFEDVPYDLLLLCIKHPHLTVDSEKHLSDALLIWIDSNIERLQRSNKTECGFSDILKQIRISLLPLWFAAGKRSSSSFSELANESVGSIFRLTQVTPIGPINGLRDGDLSHLRIRLTEYSKRVDLSGCLQITTMILLLSLLPNTHSVGSALRKSIEESISNLEQADGSKYQIPQGLLPTLSFEAVQEVDISGCLKLHLEAAIECFSKSFPSLRKVKAAYLLNFKTTTLYRLVQKCSLVSEVDITVDMDPLISSQVSVISPSSAVISLAQNRPYTVGDSSSVTSLYHLGHSLSNITKLTLEGRSDVCDSDIQYIAKFCVSLCYLNLKGCISLTDVCIANLIRRCTKLHSIVVCHTSFGMNSILALCTASSILSNSPTAQFGKKHLDSLAANLQLLHMGADEASLQELLSQTQMLKSLCLGDTNLVDDALCNFSGSFLEMLDISNTMISTAALNLVVRTNPGLKCLNARGCKNLFQPENTTKVAKFSSPYTCEELFIELGKTCRLEEIALGWGFSYFSLQGLKPAILSLRAMTVGLGGSLPEDALRLLPTTCPMLESLVLYFQVISDCIIINIMKSLRQLQTLAFCYCLGDISISSFKLSMPNLRKLRLERVTPWLTNNDLVLLTQNFANLVELALLGCKLLNSEAQCIISSGWPGLISIHLEDCGEVTRSGVCSLFNCTALEDLLLRHNGPGIQRNFILDAASKMPMLRQVSLDLCDASEGDFDLPDDADRYCLRSVKIARCKSQRCNVGPYFAEAHRKPVHRETLVLENDPHDGKRKCETSWPIFKIAHQKSRYTYAYIFLSLPSEERNI
ncbi:BTB/Kelch-associated - like 1 [Theobroma cacao]|nr:BTB/Kelch-associated - like 1 [Theobroma cacao]